MSQLVEYAGDIASLRGRLDSEWDSLKEVFNDQKSREFEQNVITPYRQYLRSLEDAMREIGEHLEQTGQQQ